MTSLYIDRRDISAKLDGEAIAFYDKEGRVGTVPLAPVDRVIIRGNCMVETRLLGRLGELGKGVILLSGRKAEPHLFMSKQHNDSFRRVNQYRLSLDAEFCLIFSQCVVEAKLSEQRAVLQEICDSRTLDRVELMARIRQIDEAISRIAAQEDIASLRGLEGSAAAAYFAALASVVPASLKFSGRNRRPPKDPLNVLMSLSYTLLHSEAVMALHAAGLDPYVGFYHQLDFGRESLACDVIEPFRPKADRFAMMLFKNRDLRSEHFTMGEKGCIMGKTARAVFYPRWESFAEALRKDLTAAVNDICGSVRQLSAPA